MQSKDRYGQPRPVWMIIPTYYPVIGGTQNQVRWLSKRLSENGQPVTVLTRQDGLLPSNGFPADDSLDGVPVRRVFSRAKGKRGSILYLICGWWYLMRHGRRGIYHAQTVGAAGWLAVAARYLLGGRCVIKMRTGAYSYNKNYASGIARLQFVALLRLADRVQVLSGEVERMVSKLGVPPRKVVRILNGVDTSIFHPVSSEEKASHRDELDLPTDKTILLWVGRLDPIKGLDVLLRAWGNLPHDLRAGALLVLVGDGPERSKLMWIASNKGLQDSVRLVGAQQNTASYYHAADLFVLPSLTEGLSGALIEAMACGLPVIASNVGGARDLVVDGKNGALFVSEDYDQLTRKLIAVMGDPTRWKGMGKDAMRTASVQADLDVVAHNLGELYRQLSMQ